MNVKVGMIVVSKDPLALESSTAADVGIVPKGATWEVIGGNGGWGWDLRNVKGGGVAKFCPSSSLLQAPLLDVLKLRLGNER